MFDRRVLGFVCALAVAGCIVPCVPARAEMRDWQLRRLLNFKTECQMDDFVDKSLPIGPGRFHVVCRNITFYPDGLDLECPDRVDEWTCKILTKLQSFSGADIFRQSPIK